MAGMAFRFLGAVIAVPVAAWILPGVHALDNESAWLAGALLGVMYLLLRPLVRLVLTPFNCLTLGLVGVAVDAGMVQLAAGWLESFHVDSFLWAVATALIVGVFREGVGRLGKKRA